jgi:hypothetical protein
MNAFDAAEKNGKVEALHNELVELANAQNESKNNGTSILPPSCESPLAFEVLLG